MSGFGQNESELRAAFSENGKDPQESFNRLIVILISQLPKEEIQENGRPIRVTDKMLRCMGWELLGNFNDGKLSIDPGTHRMTFNHTPPQATFSNFVHDEPVSLVVPAPSDLSPLAKLIVPEFRSNNVAGTHFFHTSLVLAELGRL